MKKRLFILTAIMALSITSITGCGKNASAAADVTDTENAAPTEVIAEAETESASTETEEATAAILAEETEVTEASEIPEAPTFTVTDMSAVKYAKSSVNVRDGAGTEFNKLGGLTTNQQVNVTGQAENGWYRIDFDGKDGFVSNKYLVDEKVVVAQKTKQNLDNQPSDPITSVENPTSTPTPQPEQAPVPDSIPQPPTSTPEPAPAPTPVPEQPAPNNGNSMTLEELENMLGGNAGWTTGGGEDIGIGGDWIE